LDNSPSTSFFVFIKSTERRNYTEVMKVTSKAVKENKKYNEITKEYYYYGICW
jgi:hypothetical protein